MQYDEDEGTAWDKVIELQESYYEKLSEGLSEADQDILGRIINTSEVIINMPDKILCKAAEEFVKLKRK
jgi:hypothetical protein